MKLSHLFDAVSSAARRAASGAPASGNSAGAIEPKIPEPTDHRFGVSPEPYANGLPADFPSYCKTIQASDTVPAGCCSGFGMMGMGTGGTGMGTGGMR
jgi:hypothetical protein